MLLCEFQSPGSVWKIQKQNWKDKLHGEWDVIRIDAEFSTIIGEEANSFAQEERKNAGWQLRG